MNDLFINSIKASFDDNYLDYLSLLDKPYTQGFFLNTNKATKEEILDLIDFKYESNLLTDDSFNHFNDNIGKTKAYELGLIYPQEIAASLSSKYIDKANIKTVVDLCSAPGGKTINILNRLANNCLCIANEINHTRATILSSNLERLGLDNVIVTNKNCDKLADELEGFADLVILDAPCSGEGIVRKYPEIIDNYSLDNINELSNIQKRLLDNAYKILKPSGQLIYSTCTYSFKEDEYQVSDFLNSHSDMKLIQLADLGISKLKGTIKLSPLNNTEGQFIALMKKDDDNLYKKFNYLKPIKDKIVDNFINEYLLLDDFYLYKHNEHYYLSLMPLYDLSKNVLKYGVYIGDIVNKRFEPNHNLFRANSLKNKFKYVYDLNDDEYEKFICGNELKTKLDHNGYYLITYHNHSLGFAKYSNNTLKNKYPKGLRHN